MGLLDKIFGRKRPNSASEAADQARQQRVSGPIDIQSVEEKAATRGRMEAEMDAQRQRRADSPPANP